MEIFSALLAICAGNSPVPGEFPAQRPVTRGFGVFFDLRLNKRLRKQSWGWWFESLSRPLWCHCNVAGYYQGNTIWRISLFLWLIKFLSLQSVSLPVDYYVILYQVISISTYIEFCYAFFALAPIVIDIIFVCWNKSRLIDSLLAEGATQYRQPRYWPGFRGILRALHECGYVVSMVRSN